MKTKHFIVAILVCFTSYFAGFSQGNNSAPFKVGAAKSDFTPAPDALPDGYNKIRDHLFCRAVVINNGLTSAALITADVGGVSDEFYNNVSQKIAKEIGIPAENVYISASHTHSAPWGVDESLAIAAFDAVKKASEKLQPATLSYNTGLSYININRDVIDPETRLWSQGPNYEGPSDKTVAVITFRSMDGEPIAIYYNYAMHSNMMFMSETISADFPGETSKYIEEYYGNGVIALFSSGAAGDQNPVSVKPMMEMGKQKTTVLLASGKAKDEAEAIMMAGSVRIADLDIDQKYLDRQSQMISSLGQILGEEILRVTKLPQRTESEISIYGTTETISCPGRKRTNTGREGAAGTYVDGDTVHIKLSLLRIGDIAITGVNAEVYNIIGQRLKEESPLTNTIFATITNGRSNSGYIPDDASFQHYTFQVLSSSLKPNHAERGIIDGLVEMIEESGL